MPLYLEYDKTNGSIKRLLTADSLPNNIAYLAYQEVPEGAEIDMSLNINDIVSKIMEIKEKENIIENLPVNIEEPEIIEV